MAIAVTNGTVDPNDLKTLETLGSNSAPAVIAFFKKAAAGTLQAADLVEVSTYLHWRNNDPSLATLLAKYMPASAIPITLSFFDDLYEIYQGPFSTAYTGVSNLVAMKALDPSLRNVSTSDIVLAARGFHQMGNNARLLSIVDNYLTTAERDYLTHAADYYLSERFADVSEKGLAERYGANLKMEVDAIFMAAGPDEKELALAALRFAASAAISGTTSKVFPLPSPIAKLADLAQVFLSPVSDAYNVFVTDLVGRAKQILAAEPRISEDQLAARLIAAVSGLNRSLLNDVLQTSIKSTAVGRLLVETIFRADRSTIDPATISAAAKALLAFRNDVQIQGMLQKYVANPAIAFTPAFYQDVASTDALSPALAALMFEKAIAGMLQPADLLAAALEIGKLDVTRLAAVMPFLTKYFGGTPLASAPFSQDIVLAATHVGPAMAALLTKAASQPKDSLARADILAALDELKSVPASDAASALFAKYVGGLLPVTNGFMNDVALAKAAALTDGSPFLVGLAGVASSSPQGKTYTGLVAQMKTAIAAAPTGQDPTTVYASLLVREASQFGPSLDIGQCLPTIAGALQGLRYAPPGAVYTATISRFSAVLTVLQSTLDAGNGLASLTGADIQSLMQAFRDIATVVGPTGYSTDSYVQNAKAVAAALGPKLFGSALYGLITGSDGAAFLSNAAASPFLVAENAPAALYQLNAVAAAMKGKTTGPNHMLEMAVAELASSQGRSDENVEMSLDFFGKRLAEMRTPSGTTPTAADLLGATAADARRAALFKRIIEAGVPQRGVPGGGQW